jgi:MFS transporter, SP family, general alpha glucoside:H+ symporter
MSLGSIDQKNEAHNAAPVNAQDLEEKNGLHSEILVNPELMNDAFDGENREHEMGMWAAVKTHPKACFWAFIMSFTIVSPIVR